ncbi:MAG: glycerate kinase [Deinococcus sp.]|nr:glycerate kinase [Deinococcus sp.]
MPSLRDDALGLLMTAIAAADPGAAVKKNLPPLPRGRGVVISVGKAAAAMAQAVEEAWGSRVSGVVVTKYGHGQPLKYIQVLESAHPVPDEAGVRAAQQVKALLQSLKPEDLVLCLISGGGSALLPDPVGLDLVAKQALSTQLLRSGATINEMNAVRKHLSGLKGGQLARLAQPAQVVSLILSDVVGDPFDVIASGPTAPDPTTYADALAVLERYGIDVLAARQRLDAGARGELLETPKPGDPLFSRVQNVLIGSGQLALEAAAAEAQRRGYQPLILSGFVEGEARIAGRLHAAIARQIRQYHQPVAPPVALLSGGETTVTVKGNGRGGRNTEFALGFALGADGLENVICASVDSDGVDGSSDAAGAMADGSTAQRGKAQGKSARDYLERNDSFTFFQVLGDLIVTGPTLTNVNDLRVVLVH